MLGKPAADHIRIHNRLADSPTVRISAAGKLIDTTPPKTKAHKRKKFEDVTAKRMWSWEFSLTGQPSARALSFSLSVSLSLSLAESKTDNHCPLAFSEARFIDLQTTRTNPRKNWKKNNKSTLRRIRTLVSDEQCSGGIVMMTSHCVPFGTY